MDAGAGRHHRVGRGRPALDPNPATDELVGQQLHLALDASDVRRQVPGHEEHGERRFGRLGPVVLGSAATHDRPVRHAGGVVSVGLCVICHERPEELRDALASAAGEGFDEVVVLDMASAPPLEPVPGTTWLRSDLNLGVPAGRNLLVEVAASEYLVFLDDDAVLRSPVVEPLRRRFSADAALAVVAFRVERAGGPRASLEYPFRGKARDDGAARPCTYFVGCGYAARRRALVDVGGYDESLFYSTEEVELGFRLMRSGWHLLYDPAIAIEHRPSVRGRSVAPRVPALRLRNRLILVRRYLPAPLAAFHAAAWGARTLVEAGALGAPGLMAWLRACREGLGQPVDRRPLRWRTLLEIHRLGGRVLW